MFPKPLRPRLGELLDAQTVSDQNVGELIYTIFGVLSTPERCILAWLSHNPSPQPSPIVAMREGV